MIHLESHLHKNRFLYFLLSNSFAKSHAHSKESFSSSIFGLRKTRNRQWLYLDDHLEKLLEGNFSLKLLFLVFRKNIQSLSKML